jgi:hypothetical protein
VISHWNETAGHWKCNYKLGLNLLAKSNIYNFLMDITMVVAGALDLDDTCDSLSSWPSFLLRDWRRREEAPPLSFVLVKLHWIEPTPFWLQKEYQINVNYAFQGYTDFRCHPSDKENPSPTSFIEPSKFPVILRDFLAIELFRERNANQVAGLL